MQELSMVGGYMEKFKKPVKIELGWVLVQDIIDV